MSEELKQRRIELGKSIEEISKLTKIKSSYIQAIEDGNWNQLPLEIYTKSYIKTYSELLGLDSKKFIEDYENYLRNRDDLTKKNIPDFKDKSNSKEEKQNKTKNYPRWTISLIITLVVFILIFTILHFDQQEYYIPPPPNPQPLKSQILDEVKPQKQLSNEEPHKSHILRIEAVDRVWMRIIIDEKEKKEYLLESGQNINLEALKSFKLHIGNAGGVKVYFNNKDLGKLGATGQVVYLKLPED